MTLGLHVQTPDMGLQMLLLVPTGLHVHDEQPTIQFTWKLVRLVI